MRSPSKLFFTLALSLFFSSLPRAALAYNPLFWGNGQLFSGNPGPVLSPEIIPVFWGDWTQFTGSDDDPDVIQDYIDRFAEYVSGVAPPMGFESVLRQYGVISAKQIREETNVFARDPAMDTVGEDNVFSMLNWAQNQQFIPEATSTNIFVIFLKGFSHYTFETSDTCAYHQSVAGLRYAIISWDGCTGSDLNTLEKITSHELMEAMTDPDVGHGWTTHETNIPLIGPVQAYEGGDQCQSAPDATVPHPDDNPLSFGVVQNFADNSAQACRTWTPSIMPHIAATRTAGTQLEVFAPSPGGLVHATLSSDYQWSSEAIDLGITSPFGNVETVVGPPAVVSPSPGQLDAFVRVIDVRGSRLKHVSRLSGGTWEILSDLNRPEPCSDTTCSGIGPPSAVSSDAGHMDVVVMDQDGSVLEFSFTARDTYTAVNLPANTIGPPSIISRGAGLVDVFTLNGGAVPIMDSFNGSSWSGFHTYGPFSGGNGGSYPVIPMTPFTFLATTSRYIEVAYPGELSFALAGARFQQGKWLSSFDQLASGNTYGKVAAAVHPAGKEYDLVWETANGNLGRSTGKYVAAHRFAGTPFPQNSTPTAIPGLYASPPVVQYGSDGYPEVIGLGLDGCLWEDWLDWWSGNSIANGPIPTGVCGFF